MNRIVAGRDLFIQRRMANNGKKLSRSRRGSCTRDRRSNCKKGSPRTCWCSLSLDQKNLLARPPSFYVFFCCSPLSLIHRAKHPLKATSIMYSAWLMCFLAEYSHNTSNFKREELSQNCHNHYHSNLGDARFWLVHNLLFLL